MYLHLQFEGVEIALDDRVGIFITMNPGYAGRTELPESVKALFRPVVVIVPDLQQICEIMLFSEGFLLAKVSTMPQLQCTLNLRVLTNHTVKRQFKWFTCYIYIHVCEANVMYVHLHTNL